MPSLGCHSVIVPDMGSCWINFYSIWHWWHVLFLEKQLCPVEANETKEKKKKCVAETNTKKRRKNRGFSLVYSAPRLGFWLGMLGTFHPTSHAWWGKGFLLHCGN
nr:hypothetical protein CFP56_37786 [Quercus suber]